MFGQILGGIALALFADYHVMARGNGRQQLFQARGEHGD
jgi:hypothetical protein